MTVIAPENTRFFDVSSVPPLGGSTEFSLHLWEEIKSRSILPTFAGRQSDDAELRREFLTGARMMGYELVDLDDLDLIAAMKKQSPPRYPIQPQQLVVVDHLNAGGYDEYVVEMMRRGSKTTTIFCWALGRCASRPGYLVTFSAQSGVKGTARLREWKTRLDRTCPDPESGIQPWRRGETTVSKRVQRHATLFGDDELTAAESPSTRGFRIMMGEVSKGIYFDNGSQFLVLKPDAEAYRGEAGDVAWVDEGQELDPEEGADLMAGILPLFDTRPGAALVISGTAGEVRVGAFWESVERIRAERGNVGGVDYCFPPDTPWTDIEDEQKAMKLLAAHHPGIGTLTTLDVMRERYRKFDKPKWAREYGSMWPETFGTSAIPADLWAAGAAKRKALPARVAFGRDIKPGGSVACIAAAWRDSRGVAYVAILEHQPGTSWISKIEQKLTQKYRGTSVAYDDIAEGKATSTEGLVLRPKPRLRVQTFRETAAGCIQFMRDLQRGKLKHFDQVSLNSAAQLVTKREVRGESGIWLWGVGPDGGDTTPIVAATRALRNWDQHYARAANSATEPIMGD